LNLSEDHTVMEISLTTVLGNLLNEILDPTKGWSFYYKCFDPTGPTGKICHVMRPMNFHNFPVSPF
jgi:hypothetical protein